MRRPIQRAFGLEEECAKLIKPGGPPSGRKPTSNTRDQLRQFVDGNDNLMVGFQVGGMRRVRRAIPRWVNSTEEVRKILLSAFPKLKTDPTDPKQLAGAVRWDRVIHFYFRLGWTRPRVSEELSLQPSVVHALVRNISRAAAGLRADGSGTKRGKRGRPSKGGVSR